MIKKAYRKIMFQYVTRLKYDKFENSIMLAINGLLLFLFMCLNFFKIAYVIPYQKNIVLLLDNVFAIGSFAPCLEVVSLKEICWNSRGSFNICKYHSGSSYTSRVS